MRGKLWVLSLCLLGVALVACAGGAGQPAVVTQVVEKQVTAVVEKEVTTVVEKEVERVVTATPAPAGEKQVIELWSTDNEEQRVDRYEEVAARYMADHPDVEIRIVPIDEATSSQRIATARGANRLPDIVRVGVERVPPLLADGLLDVEAATAVIEDLGVNDFYEGPLRWVTTEDGAYAAVPYDGWLQAVWYRTDAFEEAGLEAPTSWETIQAACETFAGGQGGYVYGMTLGTDPGQNYGAQVFEQVAMANNAWPFDADGNVTFNTPEMIEALTWYTGLQACSAPGPNYWQQARQNYITGQAPMLFYSTYVMDDLAGLQEGVEPTVEGLAEKTGFAPEMQGASGDRATYGQLVVLAIMAGADPATADVVKYFLTEGYQDVLALAPNGKIPVLKSAVEGWKQNEIFASYPPEVLDQVANGYEAMQRWAFRPEYDPVERAVIGDIEGRLLVPQVVSQIALEQSMTPEQGAQFLQEQTEAILAERRAEAESSE